MELALKLDKPPASPPPQPTKTPMENLGLGLWFSTESSLKSHTHEHHNPSTSSNSPLHLGLPCSTETTSLGSGETVTPASDNEATGLSSARKKLRLSKEQSVYLEKSFKKQRTLNPKLKAELSKELRLRPRQVEVWFQNRRARMKMKQTEEDCSYLKQFCRALTVENRRLQKEISDLRALNAGQPFYMHLPATTLSLCPKCDRASAAGGGCGTIVSDRGKATSLASLLDKPGFFPFPGYAGTSHQSSSA